MYLNLLDCNNAINIVTKNKTANTLCVIGYSETENTVTNKRSTPGILHSLSCKK
jgi:hypothetical protein